MKLTTADRLKVEKMALRAIRKEIGKQYGLTSVKITIKATKDYHYTDFVAKVRCTALYNNGCSMGRFAFEVSMNREDGFKRIYIGFVERKVLS